MGVTRITPAAIPAAGVRFWDEARQGSNIIHFCLIARCECFHVPRDARLSRYSGIAIDVNITGRNGSKVLP